MNDDEVRQLVKDEVARAVAALPGTHTVYVPAREALRKEYQQRAVNQVLNRIDAIGMEARNVLRFMLGQERSLTASAIAQGVGINNIQIGGRLKVLTENGVVTRGGAAGGGTSYRHRIREWVTDQLEPHSPPEDEVENVYQEVLARVAGDGLIA